MAAGMGCVMGAGGRAGWHCLAAAERCALGTALGELQCFGLMKVHMRLQMLARHFEAQVQSMDTFNDLYITATLGAMFVKSIQFQQSLTTVFVYYL